MEVKYTRGMTTVWSDGEKITIVNAAGIRWVNVNVDELFGVGEWDKIHESIYFKVDHVKDKTTSIRKYECVSGYIPQRIIEDLASEPDLPKDVEKANALEALRNV